VAQLKFSIWMIELRTVTATSDNTVTLVSQKAPRQLPLLSDLVVTFFSSIVILTQNGQFLDCATIAFSERNVKNLLVNSGLCCIESVIYLFGEQRN
jgi:hypothetical protein